MTDNEVMLDIAQAHLGFSDEQMELFKNNPRNLEILSKIPQLMNTVFTAEVVEAYGCICKHKIGQKIIINGDGSLLTNESPEKVCVFLMQTITPIVFSAQEFIYAGLDPNHLKFKRLGCIDVGVKCGGIGHVTIEFESHDQVEPGTKR